jgi:hypothetical protein
VSEIDVAERVSEAGTVACVDDEEAPMGSEQEQHGKSDRDDERESESDALDETDQSNESDDEPAGKPGRGGDRDERNVGG